MPATIFGSNFCRTWEQKSDYQVPRECRAHLKSNESRENQSSADRLIVAQGSTEKGKRREEKWTTDYVRGTLV